MSAEVWKTDTEIEKLIGASWVEDFDLDRCTMKECVTEANHWLKQRGYVFRMVQCMDIGDELSWLVRSFPE